MASIVKVLSDYFGKKPGQTLKEFNEELKALSVAEKYELASGAAKELGVVLDGQPAAPAADSVAA